MDFSILTYNFSDQFNIGDYIQSLAAKQFLPKVDHYICRESLSEYSGPETKMIMNGWYMNQPENWPPSASIIPLFISLHINPIYAERMLKESGLAYLKKHEPIGCRDLNTKKMLEEKGIRTYFSACLTLTLGKSYNHQADEDIYLVDALPRYPTRKSVFKSSNSLHKSITSGDIFLLGKKKKLLKKILSNDMIESAKEMTHLYPASDYPTEDSRFELAEEILKKYEKAKLVITSRIHCALPCLAMGTPVIFADGGFKPADASRFNSFTNLFHTVSMSKKGNPTFNFDIDAVRKTGRLQPKTEHLKYLDALEDHCGKFIAEEK